MSSPSELKLIQRIDTDDFREFVLQGLHLYVQKSLVSESDLSFVVASKGRYRLRIRGSISNGA